MEVLGRGPYVDVCQTAKTVQELHRVRDRVLKAVIWLLNSPDHNLIKHLQDVLKQAWCDIHVKARTQRFPADHDQY